jgi:hypothetical protein
MGESLNFKTHNNNNNIQGFKKTKHRGCSVVLSLVEAAQWF